jgi:hypothetical protein
MDAKARIVLSRRVELLQSVKTKIAKLEGELSFMKSLVVRCAMFWRSFHAFATGKEFEALFITPVDVKSMAAYLGIDAQRYRGPANC